MIPSVYSCFFVLPCIIHLQVLGLCAVKSLEIKCVFSCIIHITVAWAVCCHVVGKLRVSSITRTLPISDMHETLSTLCCHHICNELRVKIGLDMTKTEFFHSQKSFRTTLENQTQDHGGKRRPVFGGNHGGKRILHFAV